MDIDKSVVIDKDRLEEEAERTIDRLAEAVKEYVREFCQVEDGIGDVPLIFYMENIWQKMSDETRESLVHMIEGSIESIDERKLIELKKANT